MLSLSTLPDITIGETVRLRTETGKQLDVTINQRTTNQASVVYTGRSSTHKYVEITATMASVMLGGDYTSERITFATVL